MGIRRCTVAVRKTFSRKIIIRILFMFIYFNILLGMDLIGYTLYENEA